jgi:CheY-like chemotaxis protein
VTVSSYSEVTFTPALARPIEVLLVEDSPSDAAMTVAALREGRIANNMRVVGDGDIALAVLRNEPPFEDAARPDVILLDLNLPRKDGREVLAEIKADEDLKRIPVIVLTTSTAFADISRSYDLHANAYVTKPVGLDGFFSAIRGIEEFWFSVVRLPEE